MDLPSRAAINPTPQASRCASGSCNGRSANGARADKKLSNRADTNCILLTYAHTPVRYTPRVPVLVVGADTPVGATIVNALTDREGELRCFVTDLDVAADLRSLPAKVALGDVSDGSHVGAAGLNCFSIVFICAAATDTRERAFCTTPAQVFEQWQEAITMAGARRIIWVEDAGTTGSGSRITANEIAVIAGAELSDRDIAERVVALDEVSDLRTVL